MAISRGGPGWAMIPGMGSPCRPIRFSALVVTCNDARHLEACLRSLEFCEERIVVDLGSEDDSVAIAEAAGASTHRHPHRPIVEAVWPNVVGLVRNEWMLMVDPDEVLPEGIASHLEAVIRRTPELGAIRLPVHYYLKGRPLRGTRWGGHKSRAYVYRREALELVPVVHAGKRLRPGWREVAIPADAVPCVRHYWVDSYRQMLAKHRRYLAAEGAARHAAGLRYSPRGLLRHAGGTLATDLIRHRAWRDGPRGLALAAFALWYETRSLLALRRHQRGATP